MADELDLLFSIDSRVPELQAPAAKERPELFNELFFAAKEASFRPIELPVVLFEDKLEQTPTKSDEVTKLICSLQSDVYQERIAAKDQLIAMGPSVLPALEAAKKQLDPAANNNDFLKHCDDIHKAIDKKESYRKASELLAKVDPTGKLQGKDRENAVELIRSLTEPNLNNFQALLGRLSEKALAKNIDVYKALFDQFGLQFEHVDTGNVNSADDFSLCRVTSQDGKTRLEVQISRTWNGKTLPYPTALLHLHQNRTDASAAVISNAGALAFPREDLPLENDEDLRTLLGTNPRVAPK